MSNCDQYDHGPGQPTRPVTSLFAFDFVLGTAAVGAALWTVVLPLLGMGRSRRQTRHASAEPA